MTGDATLGTSAGPAGRVGTSLPALVAHVAADYRLGEVSHWSVLATGYEDCNIDLRAGAARVVIKVFAAVGRPDGIAARTAGLIDAVRAAGVRHPRLHADAAGSQVHAYDGHRLLVMDFAPGRTFYDLGRPPDQAELARVVEQAVRIHGCDAQPEPVFDSWAIANLVPLAGQVGDLLDARQRRLVDDAIAAMTEVGFWSLPVTLIHADLTAGNVLLGPDGELTVLDFALANRWPRLQELAVIAASLHARLPGNPAVAAGRGRAAVLGRRAYVAAHAAEEAPALPRPRRGGDGTARRAQPVAAGQPGAGDRPADRDRDRRPGRLRRLASALAILGDDPVGQLQDRVGYLHQRRVVGGEQRGHALGADDGTQQAHDLLAGFRVELAGRLVGEQQPRAGREGAGDGDALLLAAGQFARPVPGVVGQADQAEHHGSTRWSRALESTPEMRSGTPTFSAADSTGSRPNDWKM